MSISIHIYQIAAYLPYHLNVYYEQPKEHQNSFIRLSEPSGIRVMSIITMQAMVHGNSSFKPLLRPLSDLNNETFRCKFNEDNEHVGFDFDTYNCLAQAIANSKDLLSYPYDMVIWLFRNHFDVFGLIESGFAIDINDMKSKL